MQQVVSQAARVKSMGIANTMGESTVSGLGRYSFALYRNLSRLVRSQRLLPLL